MANEKRLIDANADNCGEATKIKTHHARIVVDGTAEKPYYSIEWYDTTKKEYFLGYSSYYIGNVFNWLAKCFEIVESPTVDAVEAMHGRWLSLTDCSNAGVYCSVCNKKVWKEDYAWCNRKNKLRSNYCPNCGAKMDKETKFVGICEHCVYREDCEWPKLYPKIKLKECPDFNEGDKK